MPRQIDIQGDGTPLITGGSNAESYSLDEIRTNSVFLDGKPIYKKTFQTTSPSAVGTGNTTILFEPGVVDTLAKPCEVLFTTADGTVNAGPFLFTNNSGVLRYTAIVLRNSLGQVQFQMFIPDTSIVSYCNAPVLVTVYYTKL
jgi:hypothetical protein